MKETDIQNAIRLALSEEDILNFRNNTGVLKDITGRPVKYGLCKGSSDIIGIRKTKITSEMVGQFVGIFVAIEVKAPGKVATPEQLNFLEQIRGHGGIAGVATSVDDLKKIFIFKRL